ncbi:MAG: erythromycin esterase family protein [Thermomicrobiales bacterium]
MAFPRTSLPRRRFIGIASGAAASLFAACGGSRTAPSASVLPTAAAPSVVGTPALPAAPATATAVAPSAITPSAIVTAPSVSTAIVTPSTALPPPELDAWLHANATPFATTDPTADVADLQPFQKIIGDARIVALGEDTHGTHEFFEMKHRLLRFLVTQMGFTIFAMEADWPAANRVNDYIHGGTGDPAVLLKGLYLWPWITQEMLDLIRWMRTYNDQRGNAPAVSFLGFDIQFPRLAIDDVIAYLRTVDAAAADRATALYEPFRPYQDSFGVYAKADADVQAQCRANIGVVYADLVAHKATYAQASSPQAYAQGLHAARIVMQAEDNAAATNPAARDRYMAENAAWLLEQAGPGVKAVLWAHNGHVSTGTASEFRSMGSYLRERYGSDMRIFGFEFGAGLFNAYGQDTTNRRYYPLGPKKASVPPPDSYEAAWQRAGEPRLVIDLRQSEGDSPTEVWVRGPHPYRSIGAVYEDAKPERFFGAVSLPDWFDAVIYFAQTTPSKLL